MFERWRNKRRTRLRQKELANLQLLREELQQQDGNLTINLSALCEEEAQLLEQGRGTKQESARRMYARQIADLRRDIRRQEGIIAINRQQANVIAAQIYNLTILSQNDVYPIPETEKMLEGAADAEAALEELRSNAEMAQRLDLEISPGTSNEESAILAEFDTVVAPPPVKTHPEDEYRYWDEPVEIDASDESALGSPAIEEEPQQKPACQRE